MEREGGKIKGLGSANNTLATGMGTCQPDLKVGLVYLRILEWSVGGGAPQSSDPLYLGSIS